MNTESTDDGRVETRMNADRTDGGCVERAKRAGTMAPALFSLDACTYQEQDTRGFQSSNMPAGLFCQIQACST